MEKKTAVCPRCGQRSHHLHENKRYLVKDLPMSNRQVILRVNRRRFKCNSCRKPFSEILDFVGNKKNFTHRYAESITNLLLEKWGTLKPQLLSLGSFHLMKEGSPFFSCRRSVTEQVIHSDINNVSKKNGLTAEEVESMLKTLVEKFLPIDVKNLRRLGIDEISLVKGQGKFIVVLVDLETHKLIGLVSERKQVQIEKVMRPWGEKVLSQIEEVSMDLTGNYKSLVKKLCPNAEVIEFCRRERGSQHH